MTKCYRVKQVAEMLGVHPSYVKNEIGRGRLMAMHVGGSSGYRVEESALKKYITHKTQITYMKVTDGKKERRVRKIKRN